MQGSGHFAIAANSIEGRDARWHLHPNTDARQHERTGPLMIVRGSGVHVFDNTGKRYIEAMSGLWSAALGFSETRLADAAYRQMRELPFYHNFNHRAVAPATDLAERLVALAPVPMSMVFFTNSGSEANDTALKLIRYYWNLKGKPQKKIHLSREMAYHGVTMAAASLSGSRRRRGPLARSSAAVSDGSCASPASGGSVVVVSLFTSPPRARGAGPRRGRRRWRRSSRSSGR